MSAPWEKTRYPAMFAGVGFDSVEVVDCDALPAPIAPDESLIDSLVGDVVSGLSVLQSRGWAIDDETLKERARNIVQGLIGNYRIERLP